MVTPIERPMRFIMKYFVVLHKENESCFGVSIPDITGCFSAGETLEKALANAEEAIYSHLEFLAEDGGLAPAPLAIDSYLGNPDYEGGIWAYVNVDTSC